MFLENRDIRVSTGLLRGVPAGNPGYTIFKGVPFAKAERWCKPIPAMPFEGILNCDTFPPVSPQVPGRNKGAGIYHKEFKPAAVDESEDCLYFNLWTPTLDPEAHCPIMFFIHGGGFSNGYSYEMEFDGESFCKRGVILVSVPYRLAALGFFAHPDLSKEDGTSGNYAVYDVIEALRFIKTNARAFGGDPDNITVFGQSAGGAMTQVLCTSPLTKGLFQHAIIQSAGGIMSIGSPVTLQEAERYGASLLESLDTTVEKLRAMDAIEANALLLSASMKSSLPGRFSPVIDGVVLKEAPGEAIAAGRHHDIDYMTGAVEEDGMLFSGMYRDLMQDTSLSQKDFAHAVSLATPLSWAKADDQHGRKPVFAYFFNRRMPGDEAGAFHSSELWYVFGTLQRCWRSLEEGFTAGDYALSDRMLDYWTNFSRTGDPSRGIRPVPVWKPYTSETKVLMVFNETLPGPANASDAYPLSEALADLAVEKICKTSQ